MDLQMVWDPTDIQSPLLTKTKARVSHPDALAFGYLPNQYNFINMACGLPTAQLGS